MGHSEKVLIMKVFLTVLVLIFSFQSWTKADDISDFQIEGMNIGVSLLNHMTVDEIKQSILPYFDDKRKYYIILKSNNLKIYDRLEIYLKSDDNDYLITGINAGLFPKNLKKCLDKKNEIVNNIEDSLSIKFTEFDEKHNLYINTTLYSSVFYFGNDYIRINCVYYDYKDKKIHKTPLLDNLNVSVYTSEINNWFASGYE